MNKNDNKNCYICENNITDIDYKDINLLKRFTTAYGKITPKKRTKACTKHQGQISVAIKNARQMGFLPFVVQ